LTYASLPRNLMVLRMISRLPLVSAAILALWLSGCSSPEFDADGAKGMLEGTPVTLSGEQVTLTGTQLDCGVQSELWDPPNGNVARLTQKGRDLKFTDDVRVTDPEIHQPYIQVTGKFPVSVAEVSKIRDESGMKLADVRLGVVIAQECFTTPLPIMGVRKGKFSPDAPVVFRFQGSGKEWKFDKLMH
jgi:hypothetical protein